MAKAEDGIRQQVHESLKAFKVPDEGARSWLRDMQKRMDEAEAAIGDLRAENRELKDRLLKLEPPDLMGEVT